MEEKKDIEVVSGNGSNLEISPVYDHINAGKPTSSEKKPTNIVVPKENTKDSQNTKEQKDKKERNDFKNGKLN